MLVARQGRRYVSVLNGGGGEDGYVEGSWRVTADRLEKQERFAKSHNTSVPKEMVFLGQPMRLLAKMLRTNTKRPLLLLDKSRTHRRVASKGTPRGPRAKLLRRRRKMVMKMI
jgi:hypothetical protein